MEAESLWSSGTIPLTERELKEFQDKAKKLEAIKELNREYDAKPIYELDLVQFHNFRAKLWKILEGEG